MQVEKERSLKARQEAANWLVTLESEALTSRERADFTDWLRESPLHVSEMLYACRLHRNLSAMSNRGVPAATRESRPRRVVHLFPRSEPLYSSGFARKIRLRHAIVATACGLAIVATCSVVRDRLGQSIWTTQLGERREVTLSDGSIVDLAPDSEVHVRYETNARLIVLQHGEALFHVARNPQRPFIVQAARTRVRAVGTVFDVEHSDRSVAITVVEGKVAVSQQRAGVRAPNPSADSDVSLGMDEQVVITAAGGATPIRKIKSAMEVAWAAGQLVFENETVAEISRRFNLYNRMKIQVMSHELGARRLSGMFRAADPESFVAFVESAGDVTVSRPDTNVIQLNVP